MHLSFVHRVSLVIALGTSGLFCQQSHAQSLDGTIDFGGTIKFDKNSLSKATTVKSWKNPSVTNVSGDLASFIHPGDSATVSVPWNFKGSTPPATWTVDGFNFDLTSWSVASQAAKSLNVSGTGMLSGHGMDPIAVNFDFTSSNKNRTTTSAFSVQTGADPVPEPSTLLMIVAGGASLIGLQRRFARR